MALCRNMRDRSASAAALSQVPAARCFPSFCQTALRESAVQAHPPSWHREEQTMHSHRNTLSSVGTVIAFSVLVSSHVVIAQSTTPTPNRLSDKDLETVMSNQKADAKAFR